MWHSHTQKRRAKQSKTGCYENEMFVENISILFQWILYVYTITFSSPDVNQLKVLHFDTVPGPLFNSNKSLIASSCDLILLAMDSFVIILQPIHILCKLYVCAAQAFELLYKVNSAVLLDIFGQAASLTFLSVVLNNGCWFWYQWIFGYYWQGW